VADSCEQGNELRIPLKDWEQLLAFEEEICSKKSLTCLHFIVVEKCMKRFLGMNGFESS
jgi:hypothetical protein